MHILEKYVSSMDKGDFKEVSELFSESMYMDDGAGRIADINAPSLILKSRTELLSTLETVAAANKTFRAKLIRLNPNSLEYDLILDSGTVQCVGCAKIVNDLIEEYIVRPR